MRNSISIPCEVNKIYTVQYFRKWKTDILTRIVENIKNREIQRTTNKKGVELTRNADR